MHARSPFAKPQFLNLQKFSNSTLVYILQGARCLKNTEKVSLNNSNEASYVYILSGQKLINNAKNGPFWRLFEYLKLAKLKCDILSNF